MKNIKEKFNIQVPKEHYFEGYDNLKRFISYFYQIDLVKKLKPKNILEIGIGNSMVSNYLRNNGQTIETCDFDENLKPDYVADIRKLPFKDNSYGVVLACEVLEHLPWEDINNVLDEISRVSNKYAIISLPYVSINTELIIKFPFIRRLTNREFLDVFLRIPYILKDIKFSGEHYWEMGRKNYPLKKIRKTLEKRFKIIKEIRPILNSYHYFFILEKK